MYACTEKKNRRTFTKVLIDIFGDFVFFFILFSIFQILYNEHIIYNQEKGQKNIVWLLSGHQKVHYMFKYWQRQFLTCEHVSQVSEGEQRFTFLNPKLMMEPDLVLNPIFLKKHCF